MGSTKIPLRGIAKMLTNLDPAVRAKLESAFVEAENTSTFSNNAAINDQQRRVLSSLVSQPVVSVDTNTLGYDANWPKLKDRLISFYEVQVSLDSNFATFQSYKTVDNFFSAEGVTADTFIRVRGVRWDGQCGNFSDTVHVPASSLSSPVVYARDILDVPSFYIENPNAVAPSPLQHLRITPQKKNGGIMVFGSFGVEFYVDSSGNRMDYTSTDPDAPLNDYLSVTVNGAEVNTFEEIEVSTSQNNKQFTCVGYSVGIGPGFLSHAGFYNSSYESWAGAAVQGATHGAGGTHTGWSNLKGLTGVIEPVITNVPVDGTTYEVDNLPAAGSTTTKAIRGRKYFFHLPKDRVVQGIEVVLYGETEILSGSANVTVNRISLVDAGTARPTNRSGGEALPGIDVNAVPIALTYGSPTDLWGEVAGFWTPDKINDTDFGALVVLQDDTVGGVPSSVFMALFAMEIKVHTNNGTESATIDIVYEPPTQDLVSFPARRAILKNCTLNVIEFGDDLT